MSRCVLPRRRPRRAGVSLPELLIVLGIISLLVSLVTPAIQNAREKARLLTCRDRERQLAQACHSYDTYHQSFPPTSTFWLDMVNNVPTPRHAVSAHRHLTAHLDPVLHRAIDFEDPMAPMALQAPPYSASIKNAELLKRPLAMFQCPSDVALAGATNYRCNLGASVEIFGPPHFPNTTPFAASGAFVNGRGVRPDEFIDGTSQTALFSERVLGDGDNARYTPFRDIFSPSPMISSTEDAISICRDYAIASPVTHESFAGWNWLLGGRMQTWYFHIAEPNSLTPDCAAGNNQLTADGGPGLYSVRSLHTGGVNVAFADGSCRLIANTIDAKVWKALGTRNGSETAGDPD